MASEQDSFRKYPREVRSRTQQPYKIYTRLPDHYAVHRQGLEGQRSEDAIASLSDVGRGIEVFRGEASERQRQISANEISPVYAVQPQGSPAVPTGQVFLRFKPSVTAKEHLQEIEQAGYEITQSIDYAPHSAWVRARSGKIADSLAGIPALEKIPDVDNVEPQMLMNKSNR